MQFDYMTTSIAQNYNAWKQYTLSSLDILNSALHHKYKISYRKTNVITYKKILTHCTVVVSFCVANVSGRDLQVHQKWLIQKIPVTASSFLFLGLESSLNVLVYCR